jgi:hypothetical protein
MFPTAQTPVHPPFFIIQDLALSLPRPPPPPRKCEISYYKEGCVDWGLCCWKHVRVYILLSLEWVSWYLIMQYCVYQELFISVQSIYIYGTRYYIQCHLCYTYYRRYVKQHPNILLWQYLSSHTCNYTVYSVWYALLWHTDCEGFKITHNFIF